MNYYNIELLDTKDHVFFSTVSLAPNITDAMEKAKLKAYNQIDKHKIVIRYVTVKDNEQEFTYSMLTKRLYKLYKEKK
jgi:hypothetical protein